MMNKILTKRLCKNFQNNPRDLKNFNNVYFDSNESFYIRNKLKKNEIYDLKEKILIMDSKQIAIIQLNQDHKIMIKELIPPLLRSLKLIMRFRIKNNIEELMNRIEIINIS